MGITRLGFDRSKTTSSGSSFVDPSQTGFLDDLRKRAQIASRQPGVAGTNPLLESAFGSGLDVAGAGSNIAGQTSDALLANIARLSNPDTGSDPFLQANIKSASQPVLDQLFEQILPGIRGASAVSGNVGSTRRGIAEGIAGGKAASSISDIATLLGSNAFNTNQANLTSNLGLAPNAIQSNFLTPQFLASLGGLQRGIQTEENLDEFGQLGRFKGILGDPTVLQKTTSEGSSGIGGLLSKFGF